MRAIVTGAANGIGRRLAQRLKPTSEILWLVDRNFHKGKHEARTSGCTIIEIGMDIRHPDSIAVVIDSVMEQGGTLNTLINNAGHNTIDWIPNVQRRDWDEILETNLTAPFFWSQAVLPFMKVTEPPRRIINVTSIAAHVPHRASSAYNASKAGLLMLTRQMARELAPLIVVASVSPCSVDGTKMTKELRLEFQQVRGWSEGEMLSHGLMTIPANRYASVDDVCDAIQFLLSDQANFLHGVDIKVSGGMG